jgi:cytosine/adenosine deaminase-related metal-dependent hydrolase
MKKILLDNIDYLYTCNDDSEVLRDGYILVEGDRISKVGAAGEIRPQTDETIDMSGTIVIPGMINVHHHFYQNITRAVPITQKCTILDWLKYLYCLWAHLEAEDIRVATNVAVAELLLSGCTTSSDFMYLHPHGRTELFDEEIRTAAELGIRLHAIRGCLPVLEGNLKSELEALHVDTSTLTEAKEKILQESERVINRYHDSSDFSMTQVGIGPTTVDFSDSDFSRTLKELTRGKDVIFHFHLHPRDDEVKTCARLYNRRPLEYLEKLGWLDENTWIAHATNHEKADINILARNNVGISHSPSCHARLGYRVAPIPEMIRQGVTVGLGVDGGASNDSGNMLAELRMTLLVHRMRGVHSGMEPQQWFTAEDVLRMATRNGAKLLKREAAIGSIVPGKAADIVAFRIDGIGHAGASIDPLGALVYCGLDYRADLTMVGGKILVHHGKLLNIDEGQVVVRARQSSERLFTKAAAVTGLNFNKHL